MTVATLRAIAKGGIHDHLEGGFHRYSTDAVWHVPHFEKMLYDQAQLAISYLDAYQITKDPEFAEVARDILEYVLRDMRGTEGGFYSAQDADSLIEKGKLRPGGRRLLCLDRRSDSSDSRARSGQRFSNSTMASFRPAMCPPSRTRAVSSRERTF